MKKIVKKVIVYSLLVGITQFGLTPSAIEASPKDYRQQQQQQQKDRVEQQRQQQQNDRHERFAEQNNERQYRSELEMQRH